MYFFISELIFWKDHFCWILKNSNQTKYEASSHDPINMPKFWLEHDLKFFTMMNVNIGT